ncbi:YeeE/YedE family protein [Caenimonas aquaedulcis]|uniref:YeeE/YedE family protein n=1 Tax=Caenimonas aquaedulcis TaxID=2793270 RepID=A0A931H165_9BURK|nr:YeeE/YedE family protein [Caenimonas aquaedulcis]MBG9386579.1 YeeE/YedE family protein [Caenimonas aquaedulcis]
MTIAELASLTHQVLWAAFFVALAFGALVQRTGFCTMGAVADVVTMGDWTRMRQWALAAGVATVGFAFLAWAGAIDPSKTLYASTRWIWLSALVGGAIFGFGMVLASGCASKALVRVGAGNLKSLVVLVVLGVAAFATLKGITAVLRTRTVDRVGVDFDVQASLGAIAARAVSIDVASASLVLGVAIGAGLIAWALSARESRQFPNVLAGAGVGASVLAMWWVSGHLGFVAEHPETLQETFLATNSTRAEALSFVSPVAYTLDWLMFFSDRNKFVSVGIVTVLGVIAGSAAMAITQRSFRWEGFGGPDDLAHHLAGAVLMGVGGVTAMGCSIGQGVSGISTLSLTSFVAVAAMIAGAVLGVRYQGWRLERAS